LQSYAKPEPNRPRFAIGLPHAIAEEHGAGTSDAPSVQPGGGGSVISFNSRFSRRRAVGADVKGLIAYEEAPLTEARYTRVLSELDAVLPDKVKQGLRAWVKDRQESAVEIRDALPNMYDEFGIPNVGHEQAFWMRVKSPVRQGDGAQKAALAYASDMNFLGTVPKALGVSRKIKMMASLDHSMHFYEPFDFHKPILFFMQTQVASNGRGLVIGRFYAQDGTLLAMASQEGLVRPREGNVDNLERVMGNAKL
jgi:acyl-CoA thioesterase 8